MKSIEPIQEAFKSHSVVRFTVEAESPNVHHGYICGLSDELLYLLDIDDKIQFDGFKVIRLSDIKDFEVDGSQKQEFYQKVFRLRQLKEPTPPPLDLSSMAAAINSAHQTFTFVVVHIRNDDEVCWIGQVVDCNDECLQLYEVGVIGEYTEIETHPTDGISYIGFGAGYEEALWLVNQDTESEDEKDQEKD